jgi:hypothetical protein
MLPKRKEIKFTKDSQAMKDHEWVRQSFNHTTSTGKIIDLRKLDTNHIKNVLAKAQRDQMYRINTGLLNLKVLSMELVYRKVHGIAKRDQEAINKIINGGKPNRRSL